MAKRKNKHRNTDKSNNSQRNIGQSDQKDNQREHNHDESTKHKAAPKECENDAVSDQCDSLSVSSHAVAAEADDNYGLTKPQTSQGQRPNMFSIFSNVLLWTIQLAIVILLSRSDIITDDFRIDELAKDLPETVNRHISNLSSKLPHFDLSETPLASMIQDKSRPGYKLAQEGATVNYPVVMVPGFVTSGLEVWSGKDCARKHFRQRLWAAFGGARSFLTERDCWKEHMMLDPWTGGDPDGIQIRAAEGFQAADYFMGNYWVWGKIIENLAELGYTPSNMALEPFDWRLSYQVLEKRDGYFSKLKFKIEHFHKATGKKVVLTSHSMGAQVVHYFFAWVTTPERHGGGGGGEKWVDKHLHAYVNIAGSHLGVPKATTALLSGEMSDTIFMGMVGNFVEQFFGKKLRRDLWTTWGSLWSMLPRGSDALWGPGVDMCTNRTDDDPHCPADEDKLSPLLAITKTQELESDSPELDECNKTSFDEEQLDLNNLGQLAEDFAKRERVTLHDALEFLGRFGGGLGPDIASVKYHSLYGHEKFSDRVWHDASRTPLPYAPNVKIYCLYGYGIPTERAYYYKRYKGQGEDVGEIDGHMIDPPLVLDSSVDSAERNITHGVRYSDGDGSVPLLSLGYICADAWNREDSGLNPSNAKVVTREYKDRREFRVDDPMRGGPFSADHVDVLGNEAMMEDLIRIASDFHPAEDDSIGSDILQIAKKINSHPKGGVKRAPKSRHEDMLDD